jgi:hypothetical protein
METKLVTKEEFKRARIDRGRYFVYLQFTDERLTNFFGGLKNRFKGFEGTDDDVHITVRGPFLKRPDDRMLLQLDELLRPCGVGLQGTGIFKTSKGYAVYIKAVSIVFKEIWFKKDYPLSISSPHLTLLETESLEYAKEAERFLKTVRLDVFTLGLDLTVHHSIKSVPRQSSLPFAKSLAKTRSLSSLERINAKYPLAAILKQAQRVYENHNLQSFDCGRAPFEFLTPTADVAKDPTAETIGAH